METIAHPSIPLILVFLFISNFQTSFSQSSQNIQTFYPFALPPIGRPPTSPPPQPHSPPLPPPPPPPPQQEKKSSTKKAVAAAVVATAVSTLVLSALLFFFINKQTRKRIERKNRPNPFSRDGRAVQSEFARFNNKIKGVVVDEDGLDVVYWKNLNREKSKNKFSKQTLKINSTKKMEDRRMISGSQRRRKETEPPSQQSPLLREKSSSSHQVWQDKDNETLFENPPPTTVEEKQSRSLSRQKKAETPLQELPLLRDKSSSSHQIWQNKDNEALVKNPSPTIVEGKQPKPWSVAPAPPPPPLIEAKAGPKPPSAPPPKAPQLPKGESLSKEAMTEDGKGQVKLKPLHWDKVNPNVEHPMVWHKIGGGSFQ